MTTTPHSGSNHGVAAWASPSVHRQEPSKVLGLCQAIVERDWHDPAIARYLVGLSTVRLEEVRIAIEGCIAEGAQFMGTTPAHLILLAGDAPLRPELTGLYQSAYQLAREQNGMPREAVEILASLWAAVRNPHWTRAPKPQPKPPEQPPEETANSPATMTAQNTVEVAAAASNPSPSSAPASATAEAKEEKPRRRKRGGKKAAGSEDGKS